MRDKLTDMGLHTQLDLPDDEDRLGGVLRIWETEDAEGTPIDPVDVVNFCNPRRPLRLPAYQLIQEAVRLEEKPGLRYVRFPHLILLKMYAGSRRDLADVVTLLEMNPEVDMEEIRALCKQYGFSEIDDLIAEASQSRRER